MLARKPFTLIAAIIFLIVALVHAYRHTSGFSVVIGGEAISMTISWVGLAVAALLAIMLIVEARR